MLVAAVFLLTNLSYPLIDRDETRYAEIPREMLATGNWALPQLNFQTYYDKPPLLYWLCAISYQVFGVNETAARLVPSLASLLTIAATMWFGSRWFGRQVGLLSGLVLLLSVGFAFTSRYLLLDGVLTLFVALSLFTAYEAIRSGRLNLTWWCLSGVFCGLAFLTKGPVALVLWLPPVFAFAWLSEAYATPRWWHYGLIGGVTAMIAAPWLIIVSIQDASFLTEFFYMHNVRRFAGEFHDKPIWYFVPVLLLAGHPWSFLTIPYSKFLFGHAGVVRNQRPPAVGFLLLWSLWCFVFFSLSKCKLPTYLLPAAPALALMMGHYLDQVLQSPSTGPDHWFARFWSARAATATTCLAGVGFVGYIVVSGTDFSVSILLWATLWTGLLVSSLLLLRDRHQARFAWASSAGVAFLFAIMIMHHFVPAYSRAQTLFDSESPLTAHDPTGSKPTIATIAHEFSEVPFYLNRSDIQNFKNLDDGGLRRFVNSHENVVLVVEKNIRTDQLRRQLPRGAAIGTLGHRGTAQLIEVIVPRSPERIAERSTGKATK